MTAFLMQVVAPFVISFAILVGVVAVIHCAKDPDRLSALMDSDNMWVHPTTIVVTLSLVLGAVSLFVIWYLNKINYDPVSLMMAGLGACAALIQFLRGKLVNKNWHSAEP